jgi:beta-lactam-binding protein with PASTA domain
MQVNERLLAVLLSVLRKFAIVVVFFACGAFVFWQALVHTLHLGTIAIPDFRSLTTEEAEQIAHDVGLIIKIDEVGAFNVSIPAGLIAEQEPTAGYHVKTGSIVRVRSSLGNQRVTIPDLRGISVQAAQRDLEALGLKPGGQIRLHAHAIGDQVISTEPPIGFEVAPGSEVKLLVNVTPKRETWVMPSFLSRSVGNVRSFCRRNHLRLGHVHEVPYPGFAGGTILRQYPPAGSPLSRSDIITIWASR